MIVSGIIVKEEIDRTNELFVVEGCDVSNLENGIITAEDFNTPIGTITKVIKTNNQIAIEGILTDQHYLNLGKNITRFSFGAEGSALELIGTNPKIISKCTLRSVAIVMGGVLDEYRVKIGPLNS